MSLGPQPTSTMAAYGIPSAYSTEQEVRAKSARKAAPVALEVNSEGVVQLDGLSTRGMTMFGGPTTLERQVSVVGPANAAPTVLTAPQLVDGVVIISENSDIVNVTITLPLVTDVNAYLNSNLVSGAAAVAFAGASTTVAPRTTFRLTIITAQNVNLLTPAAQPSGHAIGFSGYQRINMPNTLGGGDLTITSLGLNTNTTIIVQDTPQRRIFELLFVQTLGAGADPEWLFISQQ